MAFPNSLEDREWQKFRNVSGETAVAVYDLAGGAALSNRTQIIAAADYNKAFAFADFGTKNERVTSITHTAPTSVPGITVVQSFTYSFVSGSYRLDSIVWSEV